MREIKFRAWDFENKTMEEVYAIDWAENQIVTAHLYNRFEKMSRKVYPSNDYGDQIEFMQYTGLKDKNGKEIYEGDILEAILYRSTKQFVVEWKSIANHSSFGAGTMNIEVIGNIYENPDLIHKGD